MSLVNVGNNIVVYKAYHNATVNVQSVRNSKGDESLLAPIIIDNFKGQVTDSVKDLLEENYIHISLIKTNTITLLQPLYIHIY